MLFGQPYGHIGGDTVLRAVDTNEMADGVGNPKLHRAVFGAARAAEYRNRLVPLGFTPVMDDSPEACLAYLRQQAPVWQDLVRVSGARLD